MAGTNPIGIRHARGDLNLAKRSQLPDDPGPEGSKSGGTNPIRGCWRRAACRDSDETNPILGFRGGCGAGLLWGRQVIKDRGRSCGLRRLPPIALYHAGCANRRIAERPILCKSLAFKGLKVYKYFSIGCDSPRLDYWHVSFCFLFGRDPDGVSSGGRRKALGIVGTNRPAFPSLVAAVANV